ncbi:sulfatase [Sphingosinithalassobacter sp. CS137]|uniref:sulfatase family protein n=1 Tax=Sphingosinithalassobacter sp. CS137 TaxID=2762748 RepID=UPI001CB6B742|nr:sulfatase-like hydrolase/transferase [Sphingosinithalassobacter sp. CS137]
MDEGANRREVLRGAAGLTLASALPVLAACGDGALVPPAQAATRPNILFIMGDDLGYADVSCYGRRDYLTPAIDGLAAGGVRLTNGYANSCVCSPTRIGLVTGRYQQRLPVGLEEPITTPSPLDMLPPGHPTLPSLLKGLGYRTALIGKWHIGSTPTSGPNNYGYDHFFGYTGGGINYYQQSGGTPASQFPDDLSRNGTPAGWDGYLTDALAEEAMRWIAGGSAPFFLSLHFSAGHAPWVGPGDTAAAAAWNDPLDRNHGDLETYSRMIMNMDANIGRVLEALAASEIASNTIVVFTSDNGGERFSETWPFTGVKGEVLEGGLRVPLIVRWPGRIAPGTLSDQVMISMDFLPTLLAAVGGAPDPAFPSDGMNLMPVLAGAEPIVARTLFWRHRAGEQAAVRDGNWKYVRLGAEEHLFDLAADARERADRAGDEPSRLAELRGAWDRWNASMLPYPPNSFSYDVKDVDADRY